MLYVLWIALFTALFWRPLAELVHYASGNDIASHILLIPFVSAWLLFLERKQIFRRVYYDVSAALLIFLLAIGTLGWTLRSSSAGSLTGYTLALTLFWIAGFALTFGRDALQAGRFSILFLFLVVPLPSTLLNGIIYSLQKGSAEISAGLFELTGVPVLREGFVFHLSQVSIEVASECSGIRSSMALLILALLVNHFFLRKFWKQAVFLVCGILVMIVKNGIRIVTLTLLASYVDPGFLHGSLHRDGGVVFFLLGLLLLWPILWLLRRGETPREESALVSAAPTDSKSHNA